MLLREVERYLEISILRLSHRIARDKRVTTHLALVGRAFCASRMYYSGDKDPNLERKIIYINSKFGGSFEVNYVDKPVAFIRDWQKDGGKVVHLTMYGVPLMAVLDELRDYEKILVVVGSEKVPKVYYEVSDYNVSITNQPHSEIAAVAIFLDRMYEGREFYTEFPNAKFRVAPSPRGKKLIRVG